MSADTFDLIVLGGGPAGYTAAIKGALQGFKVAVVERERIGGACINHGCIPTKALWGTALEIERLKHLKKHGIRISGDVTFEFHIAAERQFTVIDKLVTTVRERMLALGVKIFRAEGKVASKDPKAKAPFTVSLKSEAPGAPTAITSRFVLLATGSRPAETDILKADHEKVLTTDDVVLLKKLPKRLTIVGGGVVACEFASILSQFGVKVDLLEHSSQVLSAMDPEVVGMLMHRFEQEGIHLHLHTTVAAMQKHEDGVTLTLHCARPGEEGDEEMETDCVLLAIGRKPNSENLGLEALGVRTTPRGHIVVNDKLETDCKGLYAAGDIVGGQMLAHKAWYDASIAVRAMCGEECSANYNTVPGAIFTIPEMASVGMQPDQARQKGIMVAIGKFKYEQNSQAMCVNHTEGMIKVVIDRDTNKVIGCTMIGHDSSNLISEVALAMSAGLTANDIANTIHPHPTLSEMIQEAFLDTHGLSVHKGN